MLGIRWTIGDVTDAGFSALRLSITGAHRVFGPAARLAVYVNTIGVAQARRRCGPLPAAVEWHDASAALPRWLLPHVDEGLAEGVAWKLAPLQAFPEHHELALDNDVILWAMPPAISRWLAEPDACLVAEDVRACFGRFHELCPAAPRNLGIRGLPPRFDLETAMLGVLARRPVRLTSELDEQGLQLAALGTARAVHVVSVDDVTICSPFPPHLPHLGRCGAHFCGLNARDLGWSLEGRPATHWVREHWRAHEPTVTARVHAHGGGAEREERA